MSSALEPPVEHVPWLDGVRGLAAFWVLLGHAIILSGADRIQVFSWAGSAVDLFMVLSGYLMAHHFILRESGEPWARPATWWTFWVRRFFRISPLYYLLLVLVLVVGPTLGGFRDDISTVFPGTGTRPIRYLDQSWENLVTHLTYAFGIIPEFSYRTALPDWSIGLEMQFYAVFPFLMLVFRLLGPALGALTTLIAAQTLLLVFDDFFASFPMPSALPLKIGFFVAGMLIAYGRLRGQRWIMLLCAVLSSIAIGWEATWGPETFSAVVALGFGILMLADGRPGLTLVRTLLSNTVSRFLGDTSYCVYLLHLPVLLTVAGLLSRHPTYVDQNQWLRMTLCLGITCVVVYPAAWVLHHTVEQPGIRLGRRALGRARAHVASTT